MVRRSATICLFSPEDDEMINAKTGNWFDDNPQRGRSNNSVKLLKNETTKEQFMRIFEKQKEFGEPGFIFTHSKEYGYNPCVEIGMHPYVDGRSGISFCNLTTMNGKMLKSKEDFEIAVKASAIIGTCQAGYTDFKYLSKEAKEIAEKDALLGVSITGIMDSPNIALNYDLQKEMAELAKVENKRMAELIGINSASRITCVKPEGSTSILLDTASGIHPRFAKKYFRRIQANVNDPVYKYFKSKNPHCCEPSVWSNNGTDDVITFCVKAPKDAICKDDVGAVDFLKIVKKTQESWVMTGNAKPHISEGLNHNVSNTVSVNDDEWGDVADYIYDNREYFSGISLLANNGSIYQQAPHEQIQSKDDEMAWGHIVDNYAHVDYIDLNEEEDNTKLAEAVACGGGACEVK